MKVKFALTALILISSISLSTVSKADEVVLPVVSKPSALQEGTQRELSAQQIAELLPWAKNSKAMLEDVVSSLQGLSVTDKIERLESGIKSAVSESAPKNSELLMRYVLNRALVVSDILKADMSEDSVGTSDTKLRILLTSVNMAIKYYDLDEDVLNKKSAIPFAKFGHEYFVFLNELNKSIFDASASYAIQKTALQWLQWDLYRDLNNTSYAPQIIKINNGLKLLPEKKVSDAQALIYIRQMKLLTSQLSLSEIKINYDHAYYVVPNITLSCANAFASEGGKSACILNFKNLVSMPETLNYINSCAKNFSSEKGKLSCMELVVSSSTEVEVINACGNSYQGEKGKLYCIKQMGCMRSEASEKTKKDCFDRNVNELTGNI